MQIRSLLACLVFSVFQTSDAQPPATFSNLGPGGGGYMYAPSISPHDPNHQFLVCDMGGVYRTLDGGKSWKMIDAQQLVSTVKGKIQFTSDPNILFAVRRNTTNAADPWWRGELAKSTDGGATWSPLPNPTSSGVHRLEVDPTGTQRMLLTEYNALFFSNNGGTSWTKVFQPTDDQMWLGGVFWDGQNILVGTDKGLLVSKNGGSSFAIENHAGLPAGTGIYHLAGAKSGTTTRLFCIPATASELVAWAEPISLNGFVEGVFRMTYTAGAAWTNSLGNIPSTDQIRWVDLAKNNTDLVWAAGVDKDGFPRMYKSTNGGQTWVNTFQSTDNQNVSTGWAGYGGPFSWQWANANLGFDVSDTNPNHVLSTDGFGQTSTDGGATWRAIYVGQNFQNPPGQWALTNSFYKTSGLDVTTAHHLFFKNENEIFTCNTDVGLTHSLDGGETWRFSKNIFETWGSVKWGNWYRLLRRPDNGHLFAAVAEMNDAYLGYRIGDDQIFGSGEVVRSTNGGTSWQTMRNFGLPVVWLEMDKNNPNRMWASVVRDGIFRTDDAGATWTKLPAPPRTEEHPYNVVSLPDGGLVVSYAARLLPDGETLSESSGVFFSSDGGNTWQDRTAPAMRFFTKDIVPDPHDPSGNTWYSTVWGRFTHWPLANNAGNGGLYRTTDRGQTWVRIHAAEMAESLTIHPSKPGTAYLTVENGGLFFTENLGAAQPVFERVSSFGWWRPKRVFFKNDDEIWVTTMGGGLWKGKTDPPGSVTYTPSTADFPNPERGFIQQFNTHSDDYEPLDAAYLASLRNPTQAWQATYSVVSTLFYRGFYLENFKNGPISQTYLDAVAADFAAARQAGAKLIVRFAYTLKTDNGGCAYCPPYGDAPKSVVLQHVAQLKPILQANADVIAALEMGFVGIWGEGYYTDYFGDDSQPPYGLSAQNWKDRTELLDALLDALPASCSVLVRYPQMKQKAVYGTAAPTTSAPLTQGEAWQNTRKARIGHHNDCFLSSASDVGTYLNYDIVTNDFDTTNLKPYVAADSRFVPVGGETCRDWDPYSDCTQQPGGGAQREMERMHWSYLNAAYNNALNNDWVAGGCIEEIKQRLGYRLELQSGEFSTEAQPGQSIFVKIELKNRGYAAPFNPRKVRLLLRNTATAARWHVELPDDPRSWQPGAGSHKIEHRFCLPPELPAGNYELLLHLADPFPALSDRPEYAIRLANEGVWEPATGFNKLLHTLTVNGSATNPACAGETCFQAQNASAPTANFTADVQSGCAPLTVKFSTQNSPCLSYVWAFPGGSPASSTEASPTVVFQNPGAFSVSLAVSNAAGTGTSSQPDFITVGQAPTPSFSFLKNNLNVSFSNTSSGATSYFWNFGDPNSGPSNTSTEANSTHVFSAPGTYEVSLTATNDCGSQVISQQVSVACPTVSVSISAVGPTEFCPGESVVLTATAGFQFYQWQINGVPQPVVTDPNFSASQPGLYFVVATDAQGCSGSSPGLSIFEKPLPTPSFSFSVNNLNASFSNTSTAATSFKWNFGDPNSQANNFSTATNPTHVFSAPGTYTVSLTVTNDCGSETASEEVTVGCPPISVDIAASGSTTICEGETVLLTATTGFQNYQWWRDGSVLASATGESFTASQPGNYTVVVTDASGCSGVPAAVSVVVKQVAVPSFSFFVNGLTASFSNTSFFASSYAWDFGDPASGAANSSTLPNPTHIFSAPGTYLVQLAASNSDCGPRTATQSVTVGCEPPQVSISATGNTQICQGEQVTLVVGGSANFTAFQWFKDGVNILGATDSVLTAPWAGVYKVFVTDVFGCSNFSNEVTIEVAELPTPGIESPQNGNPCEGDATWLHGTGGVGYQWITPGGPLFSGQEIQFPAAQPSHSGTYFLTVTNGAGCTASMAYTMTVRPLPLVELSGLAANYTDQDPQVLFFGSPQGPGAMFSGPGVFGSAGVAWAHFLPSVAGLGQHLITYTFTDIYGCSGTDSAWVTVSPFVSTMLPEGFEGVQVFPNPNDGVFYLKIKLTDGKSLKISLLNAIGQVLESRFSEFPAGESVLFFEKNRLAGGVYFLEILDGERRTVLRAMVGN